MSLFLPSPSYPSATLHLFSSSSISLLLCLDLPISNCPSFPFFTIILPNSLGIWPLERTKGWDLGITWLRWYSYLLWCIAKAPSHHRKEALFMYQAKSIPKTMLIGTPQRPTSIGITTMLPSLLPPLQTSLNSSLSPCFGVRAIRPPSSVTCNLRSRPEPTLPMF